MHAAEKIATLATRFNIHSLVVEDILNTHHRGKIEILDESILVVSKTVEIQSDWHVGIQHFCLVLTRKAVLYFDEAPTTIFESLPRRIREGRRRIQKMGSDYLAWALLDALVDHYLGVKNEITHLHKPVRP